MTTPLRHTNSPSLLQASYQMENSREMRLRCLGLHVQHRDLARPSWRPLCWDSTELVIWNESCLLGLAPDPFFTRTGRTVVPSLDHKAETNCTNPWSLVGFARIRGM